MRRDDRIAISADRNDTPVNRYIPVLSFSRYGCFNRRYPIPTPLNELAKQYGVSAYTVRKALTLLERRGYTKTLNGKGTMVLTPDQLNTEQALLDITTKRDALTYLYSLQLMVLLSYPVAAYTAPHFSEDDLKALAAQNKKPGIVLANLFQMIFKRLTLVSLQTIWQETSQVTEWGFYFAFYPQGPMQSDSLIKSPVEHITVCVQETTLSLPSVWPTLTV